MNREKLFALATRRDLREEELYTLLKGRDFFTNYWEWMLTDPIDLSFELCRTEWADLSLCGALLTAILREAHFDNYAFQPRVDRGEVAAVLTRMAQVWDGDVQKHPLLLTLDELWQEGGRQVPALPGVYCVLLPDGEPRFHEDSRGGYPPKELCQAWEQGGGKCLYIGKASGRRGLRGRLRQYLRCGYAGGKNHRGGRAIWQVAQQGDLRITWQVCDEADALERHMLRQYRDVFGCYPVANRRE